MINDHDIIHSSHRGSDISSNKLISLILPCYNEESNIEFSYDTIMNVWNQNALLQAHNLELVYIDDGSTDRTIYNILQLIKKDSRVKLVELSRNFGKEIALSAGLSSCLGDAAIMLDVDMQYPAQKLPEFVAKWLSGFEIVIGVRDSKKTTNLIEKLGSKLFYTIMDRISETQIKSGALDYRLIDRKVIEQFKRLTEKSRITRTLIDWLGFKKVYISYKENPRSFGTPAYNFQKRLQLALNSFVSHSFFPMLATGYLGFIIICLSLPIGSFIFVTKYFLNDPWQWNITTGVGIAILNTFLTGIILSCFGLTANYIANIQKETMNRPLYIIRNSSFHAGDIETMINTDLDPRSDSQNDLDKIISNNENGDLDDIYNLDPILRPIERET
jgi:polyisoprenyl-phosphate glycosyltransferase